MKDRIKKVLCKFLREESGQMLPWIGLMMMGLVGVSGLAIDAGHVMVGYSQLKAATNAAALAGGEAMPNSNYATVAQDYSSSTGNYNTSTNLTNVQTTVAAYCSSTVTSWGIGCQTPVGGSSAYNAIVVTETANVNTFFMRIFGIPSISVSATSSAAMRGARPIPYNVAIIVDSTQSMTSTDSDSQCNSSRFTCALAGVRVLLQNLAPCIGTCGSATSGSNGSANVTNPVDHVALFTFPNATVGSSSNHSISADYSCGSSSPSVQHYIFPPATFPSGYSSYVPGTVPASSGSTYTPSTSSSAATYLVVDFSTDYKTTETTSTLYSGSNLVKAVGGNSSCTAMSPHGGAGTYYAGVINAAQEALVAEQANNPGSQNVMVIISDGDASESSSDLTSPGSSNSNGAYPSYVDECNQAVAQAKLATAAGTRVYAVAYGAESSGCLNGSRGETAAQTGYIANITPCQTMQNIASNSAYFYSDYTQSGGGQDTSCIGTATSTSNLNQIFSDIAGSLTTSRLMSNSSTCTAAYINNAEANDTSPSSCS